jgi:hypothetical protein
MDLNKVVYDGGETCTVKKCYRRLMCTFCCEMALKLKMLQNRNNYRYMKYVKRLIVCKGKFLRIY